MSASNDKLQPTLIMFSGLPGGGKTTLARNIAQQLSISLFSKDHLESVLLNNDLTEGNSIYSYYLILELAELHLSLGISVILDAVFPLEGFRTTVKEMTLKHDANLKIIYVHCSNENVWKNRMQNREQFYEGFSLKGWKETLRVKEYFEEWQNTDLLTIDSLHSVEENTQVVLEYLLK